MKENLIVVDFDKTLIPFDSFRKFILLWFKKYPLSISLLLLLRKIKILNAEKFKRLLIQRAIKDQKFGIKNEAFSNSLLQKINKEVLLKIKSEQKQDTTILLLSASPDLYIEQVGNKLGFKAKGSYFDSNKNFIHLFGSLKIDYLKKHYPREKFNYLYAISDSDSDIKMMNMFITSDLLSK